MHIAMIGTGYVGLVTGACLADFGHDVIGVDIDQTKIEALQKGHVPIYEPGLDELVARNLREGRLLFSTDLASAVGRAQVVFLAVGTPSRRGDGYADLSYVYGAARQAAAAIKRFTVIATKSTVPIGTGDEVERIIKELRPDAEFSVVSNPEFLREGAAIEDFKRPDRVVVGTSDPRARAVMADVYRPLYLNQNPLMFTDRRSAELIKYAANAFLATKITFINEMADLCEEVGADVQDVARGIGLDKRIGPKFLHAGPGYGGSCFPKDTLALLRTGQQHGVPLRLVEAVVNVNDARKSAMARKVAEALGSSLQDKTLAILGLTFKPNTDDMRDSPAIPLIYGLLDRGASIRAYDPKGMEEAKKILAGIDFCADAYDCASGADAAVIVTEWDEFRALDLDRLKSALISPVVVDLRNIYPPSDLRQRGFHYTSIGRA